ncbi:TetR/AcrR family transcriptional regulator C-terminal domain-containing protein [Nocardioides coralli]|uniref:TetR/AcrR family transcriptional regulator C-terminal domain-containing protein n=1 Tax=Nocardioides coralli TaxID=2872154 RepID=UPI001CA3C626|nr:TetR/AcrR family transcriptional regulator C-terminal domain-containing protein [Nocardioides coralli]QZY28201.1 TetR/AcrR family transcriptional regulator C-terminal domain-containing protein [Nocardioides coralli]
MRHRRDDVVDHALRVLDDFGLADLTMRRLGAELGVRPSALYHHFADKQTLLAALADEILVRGRRPLPAGPWDDRARAACHVLRDSCLAYRDGAEVVATARAFGLGARAPYDDLVAVLTDGGLPGDLAAAAARTLLHYVLGHALDEQTQRQAGSAGALDHDPATDHTADVDLGLDLVLAGLRARVSG